MASENVLPELRKLQITPTLPQVKLLDSNLPIQLNPFFHNDLKNTVPGVKVLQKTSTIIKPIETLNYNRTASQNCRRCRYRRTSESVLDELKHTSSNSASDSLECKRVAPSRVYKQTLRKSTSSVGGSGNRKVLLREPVLKALQTCIHPHSSVRRKLLASVATAKEADRNDDTLSSKSMSNFRDLIEECHSLLSEDVDFSGRLNKLCLSNRNSKTFTTIQTPQIQSTTSSNKSTAIPNAAVLSLPSQEITALNEDPDSVHSMLLLQPPQLGSCTNLQQRSISNISSDQVSNHTRCNTTCSQQAGNSVATAACDDVTIDELASYFDTFVHIPKKMSSMAEMMYI